MERKGESGTSGVELGGWNLSYKPEMGVTKFYEGWGELRAGIIGLYNNILPSIYGKLIIKQYGQIY